METNPTSLGCTGSGLHPAAIVLHSEAGGYGPAVRAGVEVREHAKAHRPELPGNSRSLRPASKPDLPVDQ
jgi:hypothetical protein